MGCPGRPVRKVLCERALRLGLAGREPLSHGQPQTTKCATVGNTKLQAKDKLLCWALAKRSACCWPLPTLWLVLKDPPGSYALGSRVAHSVFPETGYNPVLVGLSLAGPRLGWSPFDFCSATPAPKKGTLNKTTGLNLLSPWALVAWDCCPARMFEGMSLFGVATYPIWESFQYVLPFFLFLNTACFFFRNKLPFFYLHLTSPSFPTGVFLFPQKKKNKKHPLLLPPNSVTSGLPSRSASVRQAQCRQQLGSEDLAGLWASEMAYRRGFWRFAQQAEKTQQKVAGDPWRTWG